MKLSKVLSLVLAVVMLFGMQSFAFTDVADTANYAEAVQVLSALDILKGYDDGSFKPEGKITRAEYATIVCRILNMGDAGATQVGGYFTDVTADHWASGYIATASQLGIVNGMGDGTFAPEAEVTYEQSVAMLVRALGYELKAQSMGGYPTGYMMIANQESITVGTTNTAGGASRATVARLTYNALTVPMMGQTKWGADAEFAPNEKESILFSKLDAVKAEATIAAVSLNPEEELIGLNDVKFDKVSNKNDAANFPVDGKTDLANIKINGVNLVGLQGVRVTVLLDKSEGNVANELKLIAVVARSGKNVELTIEPSLLAKFDTANQVAEYYETNDDEKTTEIKLDSSVTIYKNVVTGKPADVVRGGNKGDVAYKFVDTDNNGAYDVVFVENEAVFVVDKVVGDKIYKAAESKTNVKATYTDTVLKLDAEDEKTTWSIVDAEGNALEVADIKAGDVLAVKKSEDSKSYIYYEIVVSNETVEGTITETYTEDLKLGGQAKMFKIGDVAYTNLDDTAMAPGKTITAKVYNGEVVAYEVAAGIENYGLIVNAGVASGLETEYQVQILTQKGELATLVLDETAVPSPTPSATPDVKAAYPVGKLIAYDLNKDGEIKAADVQGVSVKPYSVLTEGDFADNSGATGKYKETAEKFDSYFITENTIVFTTDDTISKDTVSLGSVNIFTEDLESKYGVIYNDAKEAVAIVLIGVNAAIDYNTYPIYVTKVSDTVVDGEQTKKITGYVADAEGYIDEDVKAEFIVASKAKSAAKTLNVGDIAFFATNAAGEITDANVIAKKDGNKDYKVLDHAILTANASLDEDNKASAGAAWVTLKGTEIKVDATNTATKWAQTTKLMTWDADNTKDADLKGFGISGKAYNVRNTLVRLLNADNYGATFTTATVDGQTVAVRAYDESKIKDAYVTDEISAIVYDAVNGKVSISSLDALETDHSVSDKDYGTQLENDDLVYIYSYDGANKLVLIVDVNGDN